MSVKTINEISSINTSTYSFKDKRLFIVGFWNNNP